MMALSSCDIFLGFFAASMILAGLFSLSKSSGKI